MTALTWNCEGIKNSIFKLKDILSSTKTSFVCLSEPQIYQCDVDQLLQYLEGDYCWHLNSHDLLDPELPLVKSKAIGGTLMLWMKELDPYIEVITTNTTAFLPIVLKMPGLKTSVHISLYLPTHSRDTEFVSDLAELRNCIDDLVTRFTDPILYIRGDGNVNPNNGVRVTLLQQLLSDYNLARTDLGHLTYHHFVGNGMYDSDIDILLHTKNENVTEAVIKILCKHEHPDIFSHHDPILSSFTIPTEVNTMPRPLHDIAPRVVHTRSRIDWTEQGQLAYCELVAPYLRQAREQWLDPSSQVSMSVLLSATSDILSKCATMTNKFRIVGTNSDTATRSRNSPKAVRLARNKLSKAHKIFKMKENSKNKFT